MAETIIPVNTDFASPSAPSWREEADFSGGVNGLAARADAGEAELRG